MTCFYLVQTELAWEDPAANRATIGEAISGLRGGIIVLPEMFSTGFSMASARLAETMTGETVNWMKQQAEALGATLCGSVIISEAGSFHNRFIWVEADGGISTYDKRHLFRMADEHDYYSPGDRRVTVVQDGIRIMPQICYDLRFPAWSRNPGENSYDVLLYVANWPAARQSQWLTLLQARAIENLCYVVAVNRTGRDGNNVDYTGGTCVIDYRGDYVLPPASEGGIYTFEPDLTALSEYRAGFPAHLDADSFSFD